MVITGTGYTITRNAISANAGLGIDLNADGVTANDAGDVDVGPNRLQNFPVIASATLAGGSTSVVWSLNSTPNTTFTVEFFSAASPDPSGYGEGEVFLGSVTVTTDANGNTGPVTTVFAAAFNYVTATATDPDGNTSEFSGELPVLPGTGVGVLTGQVIAPSTAPPPSAPAPVFLHFADLWPSSPPSASAPSLDSARDAIASLLAAVHTRRETNDAFFLDLADLRLGVLRLSGLE